MLLCRLPVCHCYKALQLTVIALHGSKRPSDRQNTWYNLTDITKWCNCKIWVNAMSAPVLDMHYLVIDWKWKCWCFAETQQHFWLLSQSHYSVAALLHKRIQDVLGSGQIFWNNGLTHSCIHPASHCVPLSPFQAHMHAQCRQQNFDLLTRSLKVFFFFWLSLCQPLFREL